MNDFLLLKNRMEFRDGRFQVLKRRGLKEKQKRERKNGPNRNCEDRLRGGKNKTVGGWSGRHQLDADADSLS